MTVLEIPGEPSLFQIKSRRPEQVTLPLKPWSRMHLWLLPYGLIGGVMLGLAIMSLPAFARSATSLGGALQAMLSWTMLTVTGAILALPALTALYDAMRSQPLLIIDEQGFWDRRLTSSPLRWADVTAARILRRGPPIAVHFTLKHAVKARHNPFRPGVLFVWWRRPNEIYVPVMGLEVRPHTLAEVMLALVRRHGGDVRDDRQPFQLARLIGR